MSDNPFPRGGAASAARPRCASRSNDTTRNVRALSGGQRQLVAVARAMQSEPRLLVLDEPTASLGVQETKQVEELIMGVKAEGTTILLISHDVEQVFNLADRILVLRRGRVVATWAGEATRTTSSPSCPASRR